MDDFIRRADAINAMANILVSPITSDDEFNIGVRRCMSSVNDIPAADVEVRHGRWFSKMLDNFRMYEVVCSECGARYIGNYDSYDEPYDFKYCPNCGAENGLEGE